MSTSPSFAAPPAAQPGLEDCRFYHSMELPGLGLQSGSWDLRAGLDDYIGGLDYGGLCVLEVGTADGYICFELERRGAELVGVDLPDGASYDARPRLEARWDSDSHRDMLRRVRNAFWLGHELFESRARVVYAHAAEIPPDVGTFDVALLGNVLCHLRDPAGALVHIADHADTLVVTEADWMSGAYDDLCGLIFLEGAHPFAWHQLKPRYLLALLGEMGFADLSVSHHTQLFLSDVVYSEGERRDVNFGDGVQIPHFTIVARR
jgi:SAM-dependent methyltransferase